MKCGDSSNLSLGMVAAIEGLCHEESSFKNGFRVKGFGCIHPDLLTLREDSSEVVI